MAAQLDQEREEIDDSNKTQFDLIDHFRKNGLSENALNKIKTDILSGDMKVDLLCGCSYDDIVEMCKDYGFNVLQKKAFVKAVKLLPNSKIHDENTNNNNKIVQRIYTTPQEQSLFNDIKILSNNVSNCKNKCKEIDSKNKSIISNTCDELLKYGNKIKEFVDIKINKLISKIKNECENDSKQNDYLLNSISNKENEINKFDKEFEKYLNDKPSSIDNHLNSDSSFDNILKKFEQLKNVNLSKINELNVNLSIDVDKIIKQIENEINDKFSIVKNQKQLKIENQVKHVKRKQYNNVDWEFNYLCDYFDRGEPFHGIYDNGKTFQCKYEDDGCLCFSRVSFGMKPNSGKYKIKFKINKINNKYMANAIGITCNTHPTNNSQYKYNYWYCSPDYIAWSSWDNKGKDDKNVPNGLICGYDDYQSKNIFVLSKFKYMSNNNSYFQRLPHYKSNDIIEMLYDSNNNSLSFFKSNDKLLNSKIVNLPKDKTFYWIVGHCLKEMSVTIVG